MVVVRQGDPAESVLIIRKGQCYVCVDPHAPQVLAHAEAGSGNNNSSSSSSGSTAAASQQASVKSAQSQVQFRDDSSAASRSEAVGAKSYSLKRDPAPMHASSSHGRKQTAAGGSSSSHASHQGSQPKMALPLEGSISADTLGHELAAVSSPGCNLCQSGTAVMGWSEWTACVQTCMWRRHRRGPMPCVYCIIAKPAGCSAS